MPRSADDVAPGAPTVDSAGPLLPALEQKMAPLSFPRTSRSLSSTKRPTSQRQAASP